MSWLTLAIPGLLGAMSLSTTSIWRSPIPFLHNQASEELITWFPLESLLGWNPWEQSPRLLEQAPEEEDHRPPLDLQVPLHLLLPKSETLLISKKIQRKSTIRGTHLCPGTWRCTTFYHHHALLQQLVLLLHFQQLVGTSGPKIFSVGSSHILILLREKTWLRSTWWQLIKISDCELVKAWW